MPPSPAWAIAALALATASPSLAAPASPATTAPAPQGSGGLRLTYGDHADQRILVYPAPPPAAPARRRPAPLAVYIHGGSWQHGAPENVDAKPQWFASHGWAFASIGFRALPEAPVEDQARDIGRALQTLRQQAGPLGFDPQRLLLLGHSSGAHLTALIATDPSYAPESFAAIKGAMPIDGAAYDVALQIDQAGLIGERIFVPVFGRDPARYRVLSPIAQVGGKDVGDWLLLYAGARPDAAKQSALLAAALRRAGRKAQRVMVPSSTPNPIAAHREINETFGTAGFAANAAIEALMKRVAGK